MILTVSEPFVDHVDEREQANQLYYFPEVLQEGALETATVALAVHCLEVAAATLVTHVPFVAAQTLVTVKARLHEAEIGTGDERVGGNEALVVVAEDGDLAALRVNFLEAFIGGENEAVEALSVSGAGETVGGAVQSHEAVAFTGVTNTVGG